MCVCILVALAGSVIKNSFNLFERAQWKPPPVLLAYPPAQAFLCHGSTSVSDPINSFNTPKKKGHIFQFLLICRQSY
jgi:hypothetical protein